MAIHSLAFCPAADNANCGRTTPVAVIRFRSSCTSGLLACPAPVNSARKTASPVLLLAPNRVFVKQADREGVDKQWRRLCGFSPDSADLGEFSTKLAVPRKH